MDRVQFAYATTLLGSIFLVICIYFDHRRRNEPQFRRKLKMKREKERLLKKALLHPIDLLPYDMEEIEDLETIIFKEIELAEMLMSQEKYDRAILHFAKAIAVCVDPNSLVNALKQTLPPTAYGLLIQVLLNNYGEKFSKFENDTELKAITNGEVVTQF